MSCASSQLGKKQLVLLICESVTLGCLNSGEQSASVNMPRVWIKLVLAYTSTLLVTSDAGTVSLNGPAVQTSDLRRIDSYVSSTLPIFPKGFNLYNTGISGES